MIFKILICVWNFESFVFVFTCALFVCLLGLIFQGDFIKKQREKLTEKGKSCTLKKLNGRSLNNLRLTSEVCIYKNMTHDVYDQEMLKDTLCQFFP